MAEEGPVGPIGIWPLRIGFAAAGMFVLGPIAAYLGIMPPIGGFAFFVLGGVIGLFNSIAGVIALRRGAGKRAIAAIVLSEVPALLLIYLSTRGLGKPAINDISTDLVEPPILVRAQTQPGNTGRDLVYPERFKEIVRQAYADVKPLALKASADEAYVRAIRLAKNRPGWTITYDNPTSHVFEGYATSNLFRFQDDFVVRVRPQADGSVVDMRSKSRDGRGDLGANAARIRAFLRDLETGK